MLFVQNIKLQFGSSLVLDNLNFHFLKNQVYTLSGGNGAGKTTLLNVISGFLKPNLGNVLFQNKDITKFSPYQINRVGIGRTFQDLRLAMRLTTLENVRLAISHRMFERYTDEHLERAQYDTLGLPMAVTVHEANIHDSNGTPKVIEKLAYKFPRLVKVLADGGYQGSLGEWKTKKFGWIMEVVLRPDECPTKFAVLPKRWIVERSFPWLENYRRLTIDYEYLAETAEAMVQLAFCQIMLNKYFQ